MEFQFRIYAIPMTYQITNCEKSHSVQFHDMDLLDGVKYMYMQNTYVRLKLVSFAKKGSKKWNGVEWRENGRKYNTIPISHSVVLERRNAENVFYTLSSWNGKKMCTIEQSRAKESSASVPEQHEQRARQAQRYNTKICTQNIGYSSISVHWIHSANKKHFTREKDRKKERIERVNTLTFESAVK